MVVFKITKHTPVLRAMVTALLVATASYSADAAESSEPIKLAINEWTGQHITTHIAGETLKKMGYNVEYVAAGYVPQIQGLIDGNIAATLEIWEHTIQEHYQRALDSGNVNDVGETGIISREGWIYPPSMEEICPGLPSYTALNDCAEKLATPDTFPKGRLLDYPQDWVPDNDKRIEALGLNLEAVPSGSEGAAAAEFKAAATTGKPVLIMFYSPHWLFATLDANWVDLPKSNDACYEDAGAGPNPSATHDCGWPQGWVKKLAWAGMADKWPKAYSFLNAYQISNEIQQQLLLEIDVNGVSIEEAVADWMSANESVWKAWITEAES